VKAIWNKIILAESTETILIEGNHYFPPDSVKKDYLIQSSTHTYCPWKGEASYFSIEINGKTNEDAAWYYPKPKEAAAEIKNHIAFWKGVEVID